MDMHTLLKQLHTKGPWEASEASICVATDEVRICTLNTDEDEISKVTRFANARLIAAAPDLLKQLAGALFVLENYDRGGANHKQQIKNIRDAIRNAEGRT